MPDKTEFNSAVHITDAVLLGEENFNEEQLLEQAVLHFNGNILGIVFGTVTGLIILIATNWLVIRGGENVGTHLGLLSNFFIGYSVTFVGSLIGAIYGFVTGYILGFLTAWIYNRIVILLRHN
jgi:tetrahydromethanopterin S-methyltransferase subunit G